MEHLHSSRNRYRLLCGLWCVIGIVLLTTAFSAQLHRREQNQQAANALASARDAYARAKRPSGATPDATAKATAMNNDLFALAKRHAEESASLFSADQPAAVLAAKLEVALIDIESGRATQALTDLEELAKKDRGAPESPWTPDTPLIEATLAEARYKIALTCRTQGDGYENWSKYAEAAARSYQGLADAAPSTEQRDIYLKNLAACTRLIHGGPDSDYSLGLPTVPVPDCPVVLRRRNRPPPSGGGGKGKRSDGKEGSWTEPPKPNEKTEGK